MICTFILLLVVWYLVGMYSTYYWLAKDAPELEWPTILFLMICIGLLGPIAFLALYLAHIHFREKENREVIERAVELIKKVDAAWVRTGTLDSIMLKGKIDRFIEEQEKMGTL